MADAHVPAECSNGRRLEFGVSTQDWYWAVELCFGCFRLSFPDSFSYMQPQADFTRLVLNEGCISTLDYYTTSTRVEPKIPTL
jgi:hypothetical protein